MATMATLGNRIRRLVLKQSYRAGVGHIGSSLSVADLLAALFSGPLGIQLSHDERHRFILSKGHAALALYSAMAETGLLHSQDLDTFCCNGSTLGVHPEAQQKGIDFATGSLGMGLSMGVGSALASKLRANSWQVYVLMSDAELNEGSVWEAAQIASQWKLGHLHVLIDANGQQAFGYTKDISDNSKCVDRWAAFGWDVQEVDGHDAVALQKWIQDGLDNPLKQNPRVLVAKTICGKGVSYMEGKIEWHYQPMNEGQYLQALEELAKA